MPLMSTVYICKRFERGQDFGGEDNQSKFMVIASFLFPNGQVDFGYFAENAPYSLQYGYGA